MNIPAGEDKEGDAQVARFFAVGWGIVAAAALLATKYVTSTVAKTAFVAASLGAGAFSICILTNKAAAKKAEDLGKSFQPKEPVIAPETGEASTRADWAQTFAEQKHARDGDAVQR